MQNLFSYPIVVDDLPSTERKYHLNADKQELDYLKGVLQVEGVRSFGAEIMLKLYKKEHRLDVWGRVDAELELKSVISLENFYKTYSPEFKISFDTKATLKEIKELEIDFNEDEPDVVVNGQIDLGQIAIEQVALVMEDNPRKEGEVFVFKSEFDDEDSEKLNPFSVLKKLKK